MKTIISPSLPPRDGALVELGMQRRNGERFVYQSSEYGIEHDMKRECGGCSFCIGIVSFSFNGALRMASSHPKFYRWPCEPCEVCAPILARLDEIDAEIARIESEKRTHLNYVMPA
jgi:hypothetical protein